MSTEPVATPAEPVARFRWLFVIFLLSGVGGLIYESLWSRYVKLFVGSASTAQILVLALFMGGMSIGAYLAGRVTPRIRRPVLVYGVIEACIGVYAVAFPYVHGGVTRLCYDTIFPALGGGMSVALVKWGMMALIVLPPCILLGMTFPLMSIGILRRAPGSSGKVLSLLYFTNSLGASLGAMLSGFLLVPTLGLQGALVVGAVLNLVIFAVAATDREEVPPIVDTSAQTTEHAQGDPLLWLLLIVGLGTGLSSFMYEIGWIRLLSMVIGSATHSFEVMLSAFIFGMAMGSLFVRRRMDHFKRPIVVLAFVQVFMGVAALITLPAYELAINMMGTWLDTDARERTEFGWYVFNVLRYVVCLLIMFPATFCAGMTLPLVTHTLLRRGHAEGVVGRIYALNTLGSIIGAVSAGILLMPLIGLQRVLVAGAAIDLMIGIGLLYAKRRESEEKEGITKLIRSGSLASVVTLVFGLFVFNVDPMKLGATVFRNGRTRLPDDYEVRYYKDGRTATVTVIEDTSDPGRTCIYTNGKPDATVILGRYPEGWDRTKGPRLAGDEPNQFLVGLLPLMAKPHAEHGALIGFGSGVTAHVALGSPRLERFDTVEIEGGMIEGSRHFYPENARAYDDPRNHIWVDDAKSYFAAAKAKYDFIISEPTNPWVSGVSSLFTVEFYREAKRYLKEDGVLCQWIQGYELGDHLMISVLAAVDQEFEDYVIFRVGALDWMIIAKPHGKVGPLSAEPLEWEGLEHTLEMLGVRDVGHVDALVTANRKILHPFLTRWTANTDADPILDTGAERARYLKLYAEFLHELRWTPAPLMEVLGGIDRRPYPAGGLGDLRDPAVLREAEQARVLMARFEAGHPIDEPERTTSTMMSLWIDRGSELDDGFVEWPAWFSATYEVYREVAPHLPVHETPWWKAVRARAARADDPAPSDIVASLDLLEALSARDGERLRPLAEAAIEAEEHPLPTAFLTIAMVVAMELDEAPAAKRAAFARDHMMSHGNGETSPDLAYQVLRAYMLGPVERPD